MQNNTPEEIVQHNLDCYNNRDIEGFMSSFDEKIKLFTFPEPNPNTEGIQAVKNIYQKLFESSPNLHSKIIKRISFDNKVIDHEQIQGRMGASEIVELVLIYEVKRDKINKITAIKK